MSSSFYVVTCSNCGLETSFSEEQFLSLPAGSQLKPLIIDKGDPNPIVSLTMFNSNFHGNNAKIHEFPCSRCNFINPISSAVHRPHHISSSENNHNMFSTKEEKEYNTAMNDLMGKMTGEKEPENNTATTKVGIYPETSSNENDASALFREALKEAKNELVPETDPLMVALERVKMMNPKVDPGSFEVGTARLTYTFRFLVKPLHAFLRVYLFRNLEHYLLGSVSIYKAPRAAIGKKEMHSSSIFGRMKNWFYQKVLPLALAPDCFFSLIVIAIILLLPTMTLLQVRYFTHHYHDSESEKFSSSSWHETAQHFMSLLSFLTWILGFISIYFIIRVLAREPGYIIPKAKILKMESGAAIATADLENQNKTLEELKNHRNYEDSLGDDDGDDDEIGNEQQQQPEATERKRKNKERREKMARTSNNAPAGSKWCDTCCIWRPNARVAHCRLCNICVSKSEIHCVALGVHVGERNLIFYIGFVFFAFTACNFQIIQLALYRLRLSLWMLLWTGSMTARQQQNLVTGLTTRERVKKEFLNAGIPISIEVETAAANASSTKGKNTVDQLMNLISKPIPESQFLKEDEEN